MILNLLKTFYTKQVKKQAGNELPTGTEKITECYAILDTSNRWQGDTYPSNAFMDGSFPLESNVPYWMVINRTCHMYEGGGRTIKLPRLNYVAVCKLCDTVDHTKKLKDQVSNIANGKVDNLILLPANSIHYKISGPLVINLNILHTIPTEKCPPAADKCIQLSSPFSEHVFQKLSRYFYTVGYDDEHLKSKEYINSLIESLELLDK